MPSKIFFPFHLVLKIYFIFILIKNIFYFGYRFPNDTELHLIMKNQFSPMSLRFKPVPNARRIDQIVESLIEMYNEVSFS